MVNRMTEAHIKERFHYLEDLPTAAFVVDPREKVIVLCNSIMENILQFQKPEALEMDDHMDHQVELLDNEGTGSYVVWLKRKNLKPLPLLTHYKSVQIDDQSFYLCIYVSDNVDRENALIKNALIDSMTGIYNRQTGMDFLEKYVLEVRQGGYFFTVCYLDINNLKYVNDTFGHSQGDDYILTVVTVIQKCIRHTDIFARMGGDEFMILFPQCTHTVVSKIMNTVDKNMEAVNISGEKPAPYSISYGMMEVNTQSDLDTSYILNAVDKKMYYMKEAFKKRQAVDVKNNSFEADF